MNSRTALRYLTVAAIVLVLGGVFVQREVLGDDEALVPPAVGVPPDSTAGANAISGEPIRLGLIDDRQLAVGELAPDFVVEAADGGVVRLSDLRGQTVVLNFWASWCGPCRAEFPEFQATHEERLSEGDLTVLAVDALVLDTRAAALGFVEEIGATFPIAFDTEDGDIAQRYGVRGLPATFFIDRDGVVRAMNLGPVFGDLLPNGIAAADAARGP